jgi:hypothetical protein
MARKAIAATAASVLLFSMLVAADASLVMAQDNAASSARLAQLESSEALIGMSAAGTVSFDVLAQAQQYISTNVAMCDSLQSYFSAMTPSASTSGERDGIHFAADAVAKATSPDSSSPDNLTLLAPFSGNARGDLNLQESLSFTAVSAGGTVSFSRTEAHSLEIPVKVDSASSVCSTSMASLATALSASPCSATLDRASFDEALPAVERQAAAQGFALSAGWDPAGACSAAYWVTLVEPTHGAAGDFDWTLRGSGTVA